MTTSKRSKSSLRAENMINTMQKPRRCSQAGNVSEKKKKQQYMRK